MFSALAAAVEGRWFWYAVGGFVAVAALMMVGLTLFALVVEIRDGWRGPKRAVVGTAKWLGVLLLMHVGAAAAGLVAVLVGLLLFYLS